MQSRSHYRNSSLFIFLFFILVSGSILADGNPKGIIQPFNFEGVQLLDGRLKTQFEQVKDFYLSLRPNDILKGFR